MLNALLELSSHSTWLEILLMDQFILMPRRLIHAKKLFFKLMVFIIIILGIEICSWKGSPDVKHRPGQRL